MPMKKEFNPPKPAEDEPPPLFKSWSGWYVLVLATLLALIALFYAFTKAFE